MRKTKLSFDDEKFAKLFHKVDASALHGESNGLEWVIGTVSWVQFHVRH